MIVCSNCETPQFLHITRSKTWNGGDDFSKLIERYECTLCGATGGYTLDRDGTEGLTGAVTHKPTLPLTVEVS